MSGASYQPPETEGGKMEGDREGTEEGEGEGEGKGEEAGEREVFDVEVSQNIAPDGDVMEVDCEKTTTEHAVEEEGHVEEAEEATTNQSSRQQNQKIHNTIVHSILPSLEKILTKVLNVCVLHLLHLLSLSL